MLSQNNMLVYLHFIKIMLGSTKLNNFLYINYKISAWK